MGKRSRGGRFGSFIGLGNTSSQWNPGSSGFGRLHVWVQLGCLQRRRGRRGRADAWGQCGSEIGRERGSTDGWGPAASERKREGRDARAWALAWLAGPRREEDGLGGFWASANLVIRPRAGGSPFFSFSILFSKAFSNREWIQIWNQTKPHST